MTVIQPNQPVAPYETVALHIEAESETAAETNVNKAVTNPYSEPFILNNGPQLQHNPAYLMPSGATDQS